MAQAAPIVIATLGSLVRYGYRTDVSCDQDKTVATGPLSLGRESLLAVTEEEPGGIPLELDGDPVDGLRQDAHFGDHLGELVKAGPGEIADRLAVFLDQHGEDEPLRVAERADALLEAEDMTGATTWRRILKAIEELRRGRREGEPANRSGARVGARQGWETAIRLRFGG